MAQFTLYGYHYRLDNPESTLVSKEVIEAKSLPNAYKHIPLPVPGYRVVGTLVTPCQNDAP